MLAWSLKKACLTHTNSKQSVSRKAKQKGLKRSYKRKQASWGNKQTTLTPFLQMSGETMPKKISQSDKASSESDSEMDTTLKEHVATPIPAQSKDTGYRLRNHSYQQSVSTGPSTSQLKQSLAVETTAEIDEMGSIEDLLPPKFLLKKEEFDKKNTSNKLDSIFESVNKLYNMYAQVTARTKALEFAVFDEEDGVLPQLQGLASHAKEAGDKQKLLTREVIELREELEITKGIVFKQSKQLKALKLKQTDLISRSMSENLTITGVKGDTPKAETACLLANFLEENLQIELEEEDEILVAHRLGAPPVKGHHRPIVFRCPPSLRKKIFSNVQKLAGKEVSINQQLPDMMAEQKREYRQIMREIKKKEEGKDEQDKSTFLIRNNKLYINGQLKRKKLTPPSTDELFVNNTDRKKLANIKMVSSVQKSARDCSFQAFACVTEKMSDVHLAYKKLFRDYPGADHIAAAFNAEGEEGYQDDSEFGSGYRILRSIQDIKLLNVSVFVIRYYGGENLGPQRFAIMKELAEEALYKLN